MSEEGSEINSRQNHGLEVELSELNFEIKTELDQNEWTRWNLREKEIIDKSPDEGTFLCMSGAVKAEDVKPNVKQEDGLLWTEMVPAADVMSEAETNQSAYEHIPLVAASICTNAQARTMPTGDIMTTANNLSTDIFSLPDTLTCADEKQVNDASTDNIMTSLDFLNSEEFDVVPLADIVSTADFKQEAGSMLSTDESTFETMAPVDILPQESSNPSTVDPILDSYIKPQIDTVQPDEMVSEDARQIVTSNSIQSVNDTRDSPVAVSSKSMSVESQGRTMNRHEDHKCQTCSKVFTWKGDCVAHEMVHSGLNSRSLKQIGEPCIESGHICNTSNSASALKDKNSQRRSYHCQFCTKLFEWKGDCTAHEVLAHSEGKRSVKLRNVKIITEQSPCADIDIENSEKLKCKYCPKIFFKKKCLWRHEHHHRARKRNRCSFCKKGFTSKYDLKEHMSIHTGEKPYQCQYCSLKFRHKQFLKKHERKHIGDLPFKCKLCSRAFINPYELKLHAKIHSGERQFECEYCPRAFNTKNMLKIHRMRHLDERLFPCKVCEKSFNTKDDLRGHMLCHSGKRKFKCQYCEKKFLTVSDVKRHERVHEKSYKCQFCSKTFADRPIWIKHEQIHKGTIGDDYKCRYCSKAFELKANLKIHEMTHSDIKEYNCSLCSKAFRTKNTLAIHMRSHTGETPYQCKHCPKKFVYRQVCLNHERTHTREEPSKPHICKHCGKGFRRMAHCREHERIHTGEKLFKCNLCGKAFTHSQGLNIHKKIHDGQRPHQCEFCEKAYVGTGDLKRHMRTHTGEKPYKCPHCKLAVRYSHSLKKHIKNVHEKVHTPGPHKCEICNNVFETEVGLKFHMKKHNGISHNCQFCTKSYRYAGGLQTHMIDKHPEKMAGEAK